MVEDRKRILDIFQTMAYNENQVENFSAILNWISNGTLSSIVNGVSNHGSSTLGFNFKEKEISFSFIKPETLKEAFQTLSPEVGPFLPVSDALERIQKLALLIEDKRVEISSAESIASNVPLWQTLEYDFPKWKNQIYAPANCSNLPSPLGEKGRMIFVPLRREGYSTTSVLLELFHSLVQTDDKICLIMSVPGIEDLPCFLPGVYLVDTLNKQKIRKEPIDLLLLDPASKADIPLLEGNSNQVLVWGPGNLPSISTRLYSGVFSSKFCGRIRRGVEYILDSSGDVSSAVDSIVTDLWVSGTKVNRRSHALLFVQQSIYDPIIAQFQKRLSQLKIGEQLGIRALDFIKRKPPSKVSRKRVEEEGIKTVPTDSDFCTPTILYEIGTSSDLLIESDRDDNDGMGHLLFVIPYRNNPELFSLANNCGEENEIGLFTSDPSTISEIRSGVKAAGRIWVNSPFNKETHQPEIRNLRRFLPRNIQQGAVALTEKKKEEFRKALLVSEKALKTWSSVAYEVRISLASEVLHAGMKGNAKISNDEALPYLQHIFRNATQRFDEVRSAQERLVAENHKPIGVIGIVLIHASEEKMSKAILFLSILLAAVKGNAVVVVSVGKDALPHFRNGVIASEKIMPPGVVQYHQTQTAVEALHLLSIQGKVGLVWIIHPGTDNPALCHIPRNAFSRVLIDDVLSLHNTIQSRSNLLELSNPVYI